MDAVDLLASAVAVGIAWEILEFWQIEPWLGFKEPWSNRCADIVVDALGSAVGLVLVKPRYRW